MDRSKRFRERGRKLFSSFFQATIDIHRANAFDESDRSSSSDEQVPTALAHSGAEDKITASLTQRYLDSEFDGVERDDLLALAVKFRCQLLYMNSIADVADM